MSDEAQSSRPTGARRTLTERLDQARRAEEKAAARLARKAQKVKQYEAVQKARERKLATRRKIIAGALALEHIRHDPEFGAVFRNLLDTYVVKEPERLLFGLDPLPDAPEGTPPAAQPPAASPAAPPLAAGVAGPKAGADGQGDGSVSAAWRAAARRQSLRDPATFARFSGRD